MDLYQQGEITYDTALTMDRDPDSMKERTAWAWPSVGAQRCEDARVSRTARRRGRPSWG